MAKPFWSRASDAMGDGYIWASFPPSEAGSLIQWYMNSGFDPLLLPDIKPDLPTE